MKTKEALNSIATIGTNITEISIAGAVAIVGESLGREYLHSPGLGGFIGTFVALGFTELRQEIQQGRKNYRSVSPEPSEAMLRKLI